MSSFYVNYLYRGKFVRKVMKGESHAEVEARIPEGAIVLMVCKFETQADQS